MPYISDSSIHHNILVVVLLQYVSYFSITSQETYICSQIFWLRPAIFNSKMDLAYFLCYLKAGDVLKLCDQWFICWFIVCIFGGLQAYNNVDLIIHGYLHFWIHRPIWEMLDCKSVLVSSLIIWSNISYVTMTLISRSMHRCKHSGLPWAILEELPLSG